MHTKVISSFSILMKVFYILRLYKLSWSLRRLYCPVDKDALVLEVGSGGNPYHRSNVLIDAYNQTQERHWAPLVVDRPMVIGFAESLPFKDKSFDFIIASHVLEHSTDPEKFLSELQRVGKAGYIETPDSFMERINPYWDHRLEVSAGDNGLIIRKKKNWIVDQELVAMYEYKAKRLIANKIIPSNPFIFHTRYYWNENIKFKILNPETSLSWRAKVAPIEWEEKKNIRTILSKMALKVLRMALSQHNRNKRLDLKKLMICPKCKSDKLTFDDSLIICGACDSVYKYINGNPDMTAVP